MRARPTIAWRSTQKVRSVLQLVREDVGSALASPGLVAIDEFHRPGRITKRQHEVAVAELETTITEIDHVEITAQLARNAGDLARAHRLRGDDAVHLAAAMAALDAELVLVTGDHDLAGAARSLGLPVALTR